MFLLDFARQWRLLTRMVERDLRSKYVGSLGGVFWTIINPLLLLLVFTFIFVEVFHARFGNQPGVMISAVYILTGLIPWLGFQEGIGRAGGYLLENRNLVKRVQFPGQILPAVPVLSGFFGQAIGLIILIAWGAAKNEIQFPDVLFLPIWMLLQIAFSLGLAYFIATLSVWLRDVLQILPVLILIWFYGTPVFYSAQMVPPRFQILISLNPMAHLVNGYRKLLLERGLPSTEDIVYLCLAACVSLALGGLVFAHFKKGIADRI